VYWRTTTTRSTSATSPDGTRGVPAWRPPWRSTSGSPHPRSRDTPCRPTPEALREAPAWRVAAGSARRASCGGMRPSRSPSVPSFPHARPGPGAPCPVVTSSDDDSCPASPGRARLDQPWFAYGE
jgi:hypothetical protein